MFFKYFSRQILFSRAFQDSPVYSSTFQACVNPDISKVTYSHFFTKFMLIHTDFVCINAYVGTFSYLLGLNQY